MKPGAVIVDLAAEAGGNAALTRKDETFVTGNGVSIIGTTNLASTMPYDASRLYSRNVHALLGVLLKDGELNLDMNDEIVRVTTIVLNGEIVHEPTLAALKTPAS